MYEKYEVINNGAALPRRIEKRGSFRSPFLCLYACHIGSKRQQQQKYT